MTIVIGVVLALVAYVAGLTFWQVIKRAQYVRKTLANDYFLNQWITRKLLDSAAPELEFYLQKMPGGRALNIGVEVRSDQSSLQWMKVFSGVAAAAALIGSYFVGPIYLAVSVGVFCLAALGRVSDHAKTNALKHIVTMAVILDRWRTEDAAECEQWIEQTYTLRPLYDAVKAAA